MFAQDYLEKEEIGIVPLLPCCPDKALCDFWFFQKLKEHSTVGCWQEFKADPAVLGAIVVFFASKPESEFRKTFIK